MLKYFYAGLTKKYFNTISKNVIIGKNVTIGKNVLIGKNVKIYQNVIIEDNVKIGENTIIYPNSYIGKIPRKKGLSGKSIQYNDNLVEIGTNCSIGTNTTIYKSVNLGDNVLIGDGVSVRENVKIGYKTLIGMNTTINYNTIIGNNVRIMDLSHITGNCVVEDDVFISCHVSTTNDNIMDYQKYDDVSQRGPIFKQGCHVGANVTVLPNVIIGKKSVVGAGSVVTKDVADNDKVMGVPARSKLVS